MRILLSLLAYAVALVLVAGISFVAVLVLAGPHSGLLPSWLEAVVLGLGWLVVLVVPFLASRRVWRRLGNEPPNKREAAQYVLGVTVMPEKKSAVPAYPLLVHWPDEEAEIITSEQDACLNLEWFDSDDNEPTRVTDNQGRPVRLVIRKHSMVVCELK